MTHPIDAEPRHQQRGLAALFCVGGLLGLVGSWALTLDEFELAKNPDFVPRCDLGAVVSCGSVMKSDQASIFGFPNPLAGLIAFAMVIAIGFALLAGARLAEWMWAGMEIGALLAVVFATWLQFQTIYRIGALCPWCMLVWLVVIAVFVHVTRRNVQTWSPDGKVAGFLNDWHVLIIGLWYVLIAAAIYFQLYA